MNTLLSIILILICSSLTIIVLTLTIMVAKIFIGKSIRDPSYPPVKATIFNLMLHHRRLYDHQTDLAAASPTFRLLRSAETVVYTADVRNVEHVLKTGFENYSKGKQITELVGDLFGEGIFVVDGEKWKQQRRLASFEFSTRFLRDFSCVVFRRNAVRLIRVVHGFSAQDKAFDAQDLLMRCTLDAIFKIGFGVELKCLEGSNRQGLDFMKAFDDSHLLLSWRFIDPFWKLKRFLNIGTEASLKKSIRLMDDFVYELIRDRRKILEESRDCVSATIRISERFPLYPD